MATEDDGATESLFEWFAGNKDPINYLVKRKFPDYKNVMHQPLSSVSRNRVRGGRLDKAWREERNAEIEKYRSDLESKTLEDLKVVHDAEREKERQQLIARLDREEKNRSFNQPSSFADYEYWAKATYWNLDEAIALSFGRTPEVVNWEHIKSVVTVSSFAKQYSKRRELAVRAKNWNRLSDPVTPRLFLAWAHRNKFEIAAELTAAVEAHGVVIGDWQDLYEQMKAVLEKRVEQVNQLTARNDELEEACAVLVGQIEELKSTAWEGFDTSEDSYPEKLDIALQAWRAVSKQKKTGRTPKQQLLAWLEEHYPKLTGAARKRITTLCNWETYGGRPKTAD